MKIYMLFAQRKVLFVASLCLVLIACQAAKPTDPQLVSSALDVNAKLFSGQMVSFTPSNNAETLISTLLFDKIVAGYNAGDGPKLASALSADFQQRLMLRSRPCSRKPQYCVKDFNMGLYDRTSVIAEAAKNTHSTVRLTYVIQSVKLAEDRNSASVIVLASYKSKYFEPKYIETLIFVKTGGAWQMVQQSMFNLHPTVPELYKAKVLVSEKFWPDEEGKTFSAVFAKMSQEIGPDAAIDYFRNNAKPRSGEALHVIAVFSEPPNVGSKVTLSGLFELDGKSSKSSGSKKINDLYRHFIFEIVTVPIPEEKTIDFEVKVNNIVIRADRS